MAGGLVAIAVLDTGAIGVADASGSCELRPSLPPMAYDALRIGRMVITAPNVSPAPQCFVYLDEARPENLIDSSADARSDISDSASPVIVSGGAPVIFRFVQVPPGGVCTARINGDVARRS